MTDTTTTGLAEWLLEQIAEDERRATEAKSNGSGEWTHVVAGRGRNKVVDDQGCSVLEDDSRMVSYDINSEPWYTCPHIATWDPKRVLAECEAKRRIIEMYRRAVAAVEAGSASSRNRVADEVAVDVLGSVLQEFGVSYAEARRPGYRPEWRPE